VSQCSGLSNCGSGVSALEIFTPFFVPGGQIAT
jgi:hypothetical protein